MKRKVVVVDDHLLIAKAISGIIEHFDNYEVLYEVENGKVLFERLQQPANIPDIVLLDISMPVMNGFETALRLKQEYPAIHVMALSMQDDDQSLIKMIKNGARGYLNKNVHPIELGRALDDLFSRGFYYPDWATSKIVTSIISNNEPKNKKDKKLNTREIEFLNYACSELTYKEISEKMYISPRTVESYRDNLFEKLGLKTRVGLVLYAIRNGIIKNEV
jgi:DNA-binding NarL/FixJ family response regulator